jgi:fructose-1-phosphate kinase PfkB-like protein
MIKPNEMELDGLLGRETRGRRLGKRLARVFNRGVSWVVVTRGGKGSLALARGKAIRQKALKAPGRPLSPVGCGDAYLGGLVWALDKGDDLGGALRWAGAAAMANLLKPGACLMARKDILFWKRGLG